MHHPKELCFALERRLVQKLSAPPPAQSRHGHTETLHEEEAVGVHVARVRDPATPSELPGTDPSRSPYQYRGNRLTAIDMLRVASNWLLQSTEDTTWAHEEA